MLVVSHLIGDFVLQTDFQAEHKHGGLGRDPVRRRAIGAIPHLLQDDGRLLDSYMAR